MQISYGEDYLSHHGILGQKWGVRRYQNPDGSLTEAGRRRYGYDLDATNHNRLNIARIRLGEARRVHDEAKRMSKDKNSGVTVSKDVMRETRHRVKLAKQEVKKQKRVEKGRILAEKGQTITGNKVRMWMANGAASLASYGIAARLNQTAANLKNKGILNDGHMAVMQFMAYAPAIPAIAYDIKKTIDNKHLRAYNSSQWSSDQNIANVGSQEYKDRTASLGLKTGARVPERKRRR